MGTAYWAEGVQLALGFGVCKVMACCLASSVQLAELINAETLRQL